MDSWISTQALITKAQGGDRVAFTRLVEKYEGFLEALVRRELGAELRQKVEAEDILQETLLRAFRSIHQFRGHQESSFRSWLGKIAIHAIQAQARHPEGRKADCKVLPLQGRSTGASEQLENYLKAEEVSPSKALRRDERFERLERALQTLSPDHRRVIYLARVEGLPIKAVAHEMKRSPEATSMLLLRALEKLKAVFGDTESLHLPHSRLLVEEEGQAGEPR